jgi:Mn-dependent DtxR family transcriptional regulator
MPRRGDRVGDKDAILTVIFDFRHKNGYAPSYRDIAEEVGRSPSYVHDIVRELKDEGLVEFSTAIARGLRLTPLGHEQRLDLLTA